MSDKTGPEAAASAAQHTKAAADAAQEVTDKARQVGAEAAGHAREVAEHAKRQGAEMLDSVKDRAMSEASAQKESLADRLEDMAHAVHRSGEQLEGHQDWLAHLVERGASELEGLARNLRNNDLQGLVSDLGGFAQRQPALFFGASMAAGFALARVGKVAVGAAKPQAESEAADRTLPVPVGPVVTAGVDNERV